MMLKERRLGIAIASGARPRTRRGIGDYDPLEVEIYEKGKPIAHRPI